MFPSPFVVTVGNSLRASVSLQNMRSSLIPPGMPRPTTLPPISAKQQQEQVSEGIEQFELPKSLVTKIAKSAVRDLRVGNGFGAN